MYSYRCSWVKQFVVYGSMSCDCSCFLLAINSNIYDFKIYNILYTYQGYQVVSLRRENGTHNPKATGSPRE